MQARSFVRGIPMSPRKMRVVANLVRGKAVEEAVGLLDLMPKKAARLIAKAVKSAAANAEDKSGGDVSVEELFAAVHDWCTPKGPRDDISILGLSIVQ